MAVMGRPRIPEAEKRQKIHISIDPDLLEFLNKQDNRSETINKAVRAHMRRIMAVERRKASA